MKKLLIHNNNTSFNNTELFTLAEQFVFDVDFDKDVDFYINENLTNGALKQKLELCDIVFIKLALSNNYLEFLGLRLAYHIRLTKCLGNKAIIPIVFIGEEELQFIGLAYSEPSILLTRGIYLIKESYESYKDIMNYITSIKPLNNLATFINSISIKPPSNYLSHHSIANEWSILRWAKVIGMSTNNGILNELNTNVESLLYYKYLQAKYPIDKEPNLEPLRIEGKGRILYIDDEWNKGWSVFLEKFISSSPGIELETLKYEYNDKSQDEIILECQKKIQNYKPDVVLLDLRLAETDFSDKIKSNELTGYKILKNIKLLNPGIQVLIFTASNKIWNLTELQNAGSDNFLLKESPDLSIDNEYSKNAIENLVNAISVAINMSFLKKVYSKISEIEALYTISNNDEESEFIVRLKNNLNIAFKLLTNSKYSVKYFNYAYLQLFQIIEDFSKLSFVFREGSDCYVCVNGTDICVSKTLKDEWETAISFTDKYKISPKLISLKDKRKRLDTNYIVSAILIFRLGYENSSALDWTNIYTIRNSKAAHFNIEYALNENEIYEILNFIKNFINPNKQKITNVQNGLKIKTFEESVDFLKNRFKK
jgi:DNA-binding NarL/FixJ family response regulator